jgi:hypothetical protein
MWWQTEGKLKKCRLGISADLLMGHWHKGRNHCSCGEWREHDDLGGTDDEREPFS